MIEIKDLLLRFENLLISDETKKEAITRIIKETTGLDIKKEEVEVKNGILRLNIKSIYKNEILIKKEEIMNRLKEALDKKSPSEIV